MEKITIDGVDYVTPKGYMAYRRWRSLSTVYEYMKANPKKIKVMFNQKLIELS